MRPFKTIEEQIKILQDRGLIINDYTAAKTYLIRNNYYNVVNMYSKIFQNNINTYIKGTRFEEIKALHIFDTELKNLFMKYIIISEKHFKSIFAYNFAKEYHDKPFAYLDTSNYPPGNPLELTKRLSFISKKINNLVKDKNNNSVKHHYNKHHDVPIWVIVNDITLGDIIKLYKLIDQKTRNEIAKDVYNIFKTNVSKTETLEPSYLDTILENILNVRNCVAHNNKLLDFKCRKNINYISSLFDDIEENRTSNRQRPFHVFIAMKCFLPVEDYAIFHNSILKRAKNMSRKLNTNITNKILKAYGFPLDWHLNTNTIPQP